MKKFFQYALPALAALIGLAACSSDDSDEQQPSTTSAVGQPLVTVRDISTTGFTLRWEAVENAGSYVYTFNGGEATSTADREITFRDLERRQEYVVAVKASPADPQRFAESAWTYVHVVTDDLEQLPRPEITLGCAYSSKTVISWSEVPGAERYEFTIAGQSRITSERKASFSSLGRQTDYTFTVRALTSDATRYTNSEASELNFTTSDDDVPALLIAPVEVISDAVSFDVYATADQTYFYDVVPAATFVKFTPEQILATYRQTLLDYAADQGISVQLAMASLLKAGTQTLSTTGLVPELSYVIFAFGINLRGEITSDLSHVTVKTTADGYSDGPNFGGSEWFQQRFYITNQYLGLTGYGWTNSVYSLWIGRDVAGIRYRTLPTSTFRQIFPDVNDTQAIKAFLKDPDYSYAASSSVLTLVNTENGNTMITQASSGVSYTQATLATSTSGEETLCVNSATTKTSTEARTWFQVQAVTNAAYGPTHNTVAGAMFGVDVAAARYALFPTSTLEGISVSSYPRLIEVYGKDVKQDQIAYINGNGFALLFNAEPSTDYTFIVTATNTVGDQLTRYDNVTTSAAPQAAEAIRTTTRNAGGPHPIEGRPVADPDNFLMPMKSIQLPEEARRAEDPWTTIHNKQILIFK